jgi:hypothetical protein
MMICIMTVATNQSVVAIVLCSRVCECILLSFTYTEIERHDEQSSCVVIAVVDIRTVLGRVWCVCIG